MAESAAQLFARLGCKRSLGTLGLPLFSSLPVPGGGLCPGDLVEVTGGEGSGKTEMLLNITAQCVLPRAWSGREIGGREVEVVWVSTDHKFDVLRLVAILEGKVGHYPPDREEERGPFPSLTDQITHMHQHKAPMDTTRTGELTTEKRRDYEALISSCLSRLHVVYCASSAELALTLQSLRLCLLPAHPDACALVLDNVIEFHWVDRAEVGSLHGAQVKQSVWVSALRSLMEEHHLVVFAARHFLFTPPTTTNQRRSGQQGAGRSYNSEEVMCQEWKRLVRYRYLFTTTSEACPQLYTARRVLPLSDTPHSFTVSAQGVTFSESFLVSSYTPQFRFCAERCRRSSHRGGAR